MKRKLSPWGKAVKKKMIDLDIGTNELAKRLDLDRVYVSSIINERVLSERARLRISEELGIDPGCEEYDDDFED